MRGIIMEIVTGSLYFVSNAFFEKIQDPYLKINYENTKRPHYFAVKDNENGLLCCTGVCVLHRHNQIQSELKN